MTDISISVFVVFNFYWMTLSDPSFMYSRYESGWDRCWVTARMLESHLTQDMLT